MKDCTWLHFKKNIIIKWMEMCWAEEVHKSKNFQPKQLNHTESALMLSATLKNNSIGYKTLRKCSHCPADDQT